jgi:hypothetical protein
MSRNEEDEMMSGLEMIGKFFPILTVIVAGSIGYGEIRADLANLKDLQTAQYLQIQQQLERIDNKLDQKVNK